MKSPLHKYICFPNLVFWLIIFSMGVFLILEDWLLLKSSSWVATNWVLNFLSLGKNLVRVILSNNSLRCRIPPQLMHAHKLQLLDISSNAIFGNVPWFIFSLPLLKYLNLAANQLSGSLSLNVSCSSALSSVDISHNLLVGTLPSCIGSKALNRTTRYSGNCCQLGA